MTGRATSLKAAALSLAAALAVATPASAGIYFEQTVTSAGDGGGMKMRVRGWAEGDMARIEYVESNNPIMPPGSFVLTVDGGRTVHLIDPRKRTYAEFDRGQAFSVLNQLQGAGGQVNIAFKDPVSETLGTGPGETVLGYPTTRHSWRSGFTMEMKIAFVNRSQRSITTTDAWITTALRYPALFVWLKPTAPVTGNEELDGHLRDQTARLDKGLVLKMDQETVTTSGKGRKSTSRTRFEVTTLREEAIDASRFAMPADYTKVPLIPGASR